MEPSDEDCHVKEETVPLPSGSSDETAAVKTFPGAVVPDIEYVASPVSAR